MRLLTEEEARETWCPFYRLVKEVDTDQDYYILSNRGGALSNRTENINPNCIASKCAMWEWDGDWGKAAPAPGTTGHCGLKRGTP